MIVCYISTISTISIIDFILYILYYISYTLYIYIDWHAAGKGPDPVQAKLDRELEEYQLARTAAATATDADVVEADPAATSEPIEEVSA